MLRRQPPTFAPVPVTGVSSGLRGLLDRGFDTGRMAERLRQHFGARHVHLTDSGTGALTAATEVMPPRDR